MSANTSRNSAPENVTRPIQSTPVAFGSRDSLTWLSVRNTAAMPMGTFTKKIHSQPMPEVMTPPMTGPTATAAPSHGAEHAEGGAALLAVERLRDERERGGEHHRPADALDGAREVEHRAGSWTGRRRPRRR